MKLNAPTLFGSALAIALGSGTAGFFLGKNQTPEIAGTAPASHIASEKPDQRSSRGSAPFMGTEKLRAILDAESNPVARFKMSLQYLETWMDRDPKAALAWLATQEGSEQRDEVMRMALFQYSETDAGGAAGWALENLSGADLNNTLIAIAENWAEENGQAAAEFFAALPATVERDSAIESLFFAWASNQPSAAMDFLRGNPALGELSPVLLRATLAGWAKSEPEAAVSASLAISRERNDPDQFANTLANWATMDLDSSSRWLMSNLSEGPERTAAAAELAGMFANQSPSSGITWLDKLSSGPERDTAGSAFAANWARKYPAEAAEWAGSQNICTINPEALSAIARNYLMKDSAAFETWKASLPPGPLRDQAMEVGEMGDEED